MIPFKRFIFKEKHCKYGKNKQRNYFLYNFQLKQGKRTTIFSKTNSISWNLKDVLKQGKSPTDENNRPKHRFFHPTPFLEFEMTIPRKRHENIRNQ